MACRKCSKCKDKAPKPKVKFYPKHLTQAAKERALGIRKRRNSA